MTASQQSIPQAAPPQMAAPGAPEPASRPASLTAAYLVGAIAGIASIGLLTATFFAAHGWLDDILAGRITKRNGDPVTEGIQLVADAGQTIGLVAFIVLLVVFASLTVTWLGCGVRMANGSRGARGFLTFLAVSWLVFDVVELLVVVIGFNWASGYLVTHYDMATPGILQMLGFAQVGVTVVGAAAYLVLAYRPAATQYLSAQQSRR